MMLAGLRTLSPAEAHLRQTAPPAITGRRADGATLVARIPAAPPPAMHWFACEGAWLAIQRSGGSDARLVRDDGIAAGAALDAAEAVIDQIEHALGIDLAPERLEDAPPADALVIEVRALAGGLVRDIVHLAIEPGLPILPAPPEFAPELLGQLRVPVRIALAGPRLAPHDAAALAPGDLVLLGSTLPAQLQFGAREIAGQLDPSAHGFVARQSRSS
ncbi:hypothetical protein AB2M62_14895 [Sphingomonas sp. MMS12-HWE2-04]|uniref:hypothetical protein n=1 Tax=Sphingomonas sp. MMS12-HWE2-04 TaxID=3234199 RepID=UPI00384C179B